MRIIEKYLTVNPCMHDGRYLNPVRGLMIHSVGVPQPDALVFYKNENKEDAQAAVTAFVEPTGNVYQFMPWNKRAWHAGGALNNFYIGVEMTEPKGIKYTGGASWVYTDKTNAVAHILNTYHYAVELFAYLCRKFNLDPLGTQIIDGKETPVIISHSEGAALGLAYPHADVEHIWDKVGLTMAQFRQDIYNELHPAEPEPTPKDYSKQIKVMYAEFLGRIADSEGLAHWNKIWNEQGFEKVYNGISGSKEGKRHYIKGMYHDFLYREAKANEVNSWLPKTRAAIYDGIVNSKEYKEKHK